MFTDLKVQAKLFSKHIPSKPGIYIAQPIGSRMRVIDKSRADKMPFVNENHIKVGKALDFSKRSRNYFIDNDGDIKFEPIVFTEDYSHDQLKELESLLKEAFTDFRMVNPKTNRKLEWMENISYEDTVSIIQKVSKEFKKDNGN